MKIVQAVGWYFPDRTGGTEIYVAGLARRLRARGHDVAVVAPEPGALAPRSYVHEGTPVHRFPIPARLTRDQAQGRKPIPGAEWFTRWIRDARPDVVHFHTLVPGLDVNEICAVKSDGSPRVIATTHSSRLGHICARGTLMQWGEHVCDGIAAPAKCAACDLHKRGLPKPAARVAALVPPALADRLRHIPGKAGTALGMTAAMTFDAFRHQRLLAAVDRLVLLTAAAADIVERNGAPRGKVVLNRLGIDVDAHRSAPGSTGRGRPARRTTLPVRIGYVGRFDEIKGVFELAKAIRLLPPSLPVAIDIRGPIDTDDSRTIRDQIRALLAGDVRVAIGTPLSPADVMAHLASLDVLCCPSVCLEGGPTVAIEARAAGTPVLGSRIGGLAELIEDGVNGRLVPPGDIHALASAIVEIAANPTMTVDRWRAALPEPRTMDDVVNDYLELYVA